MKNIFAGLLLTISLSATAQGDTVSIMYYNLLNFPSADASRTSDIKTIIQHTTPDLFLVNELQSLYGANLILTNSLNVDGVTHYSKAIFYNGTDTDNMLFYNNEKFGLIEQFQISTSIRDISEYHLYYKEPNMTASSDTIHLWAYSCHLKAGSYPANEDQRETEAQVFKNYLTNLNRSGNLIIGGDFNFYSGSEAACTEILTGGNIDFNDPINLIGNWHNNSNYTSIHTQSTRGTGGNAGGSSGGMDDRFDLIFATDAIMQGSNKLQYLNNSYKAIGQDGNHFNTSVNNGANSAVPTTVANALYNSSDHLPVYMEMTVDVVLGVQENEDLVENYQYLPNQNIVKVQLEKNNQLLNATLYDVMGQKVYSNRFVNTKNIKIDLPQLSGGVYLLQLTSEDNKSTIKLIIE